MPEYGLWMLIILNSEMFLLFVFSLYRPATRYAQAAVNCGSGPADHEVRERHAPVSIHGSRRNHIQRNIAR